MRLVAVALLLFLAGCATVMWITPQPVLDEYATARVRIYRSGRSCRIEVITATNTIVTKVTQCLIVPTRMSP